MTLDAYGTNRSRLIFRNSVVRGTQTNIDAHNGDLRLVVNSGNRLNITSAGNIGIGVTDPTQKLEVYSGQTGRPTFRHSGGFGGVQIAGPQNASGASLMFTRGYDVVGGGTTTYSIFLAGNTQSLHFVSGDPSEYETKTKLLLSSAGNVGIGTVSPSEKLHITVPGNQRQTMSI